MLYYDLVTCKIKEIKSLSDYKLACIFLNIWFLQLSPSMRQGETLQRLALAHGSTAVIEQRQGGN